MADKKGKELEGKDTKGTVGMDILENGEETSFDECWMGRKSNGEG